jgi:glycosyltransferase involved in cell wall biosynthesis
MNRKKVEVLHVSSGHEDGGAARAAYRIHSAQMKSGLQTTMLVNGATSEIDGIKSPKSSALRKIRAFVSPILTAAIEKLQKPRNPVLHSPSYFSSFSVQEINRTSAEVVNLHWINGGMLSIFAIAKIKKPIVWTLHDTWAFSGAEHYDGGDERWKERYSKKSRPKHDKGMDINRITWILKSVFWRKGFGIVAPSDWMKRCAQESSLMADWPVRVIPYPIDSKVWKPIDKHKARTRLNLPLKTPIVLFGAVGGTRDLRKGFDLLQASISEIKKKIPEVQFYIFGGGSSLLDQMDVPVRSLGVLNDENLALAYSAADVFVIPSRQDNLPNTGIESQACGTPVVAFDVGGLSDVVEHLRTGYLAKPFDIYDFAQGIHWAYEKVQGGEIGGLCRARVETLFNEERVAAMYLEFYQEVLQRERVKKSTSRLRNPHLPSSILKKAIGK